MANEIKNEQAKLRAALCNGIALSIFTVGDVIPLIGGIYNWFRSPGPLSHALQNAAMMLVWLMLAAIFHMAGTLILERMTENG